MTSGPLLWSVPALLPLGGCGGVMDPQGPVAAAERLILFNATGIMLVVVVPVIVMTLGFAWWFRAGNPRAKRRPDWEYSGQVELVVWSIPAMVVILLAGVGWFGSHALDPRQPLAGTEPPLEVQVVSLDWKWLFIYPGQGVATVNDLVVPAGRPIRFQLTSATVMTAFFVPQLGSMIYTMPGMTTHLNLQADRPGAYPGLASHYSGAGFPDMRFTVRAMAPPAYEAWLQDAKTRPAADLDALWRSGTATPSVHGGVAPSLFDDVLDRAVRPVAAGAAQGAGPTLPAAAGGHGMGHGPAPHPAPPQRGTP